jgi:tripartite ATP-independent transporter DctP family solute receptor
MKLYKLLAAVIASLIATMAPAQDMKERTIKVGIGLNEDHPQGMAVKFFGEQVAKKSGGKMQVKLFPSGQLGNDVTMISALQGGTQEMVVPDTGTLVSQVKEFGVINLPFLFQSGSEADAVLDGAFGQKLLIRLQEKGLIGLGYWENGFRHVTNSRKAINKVEDFAGLKLRVIQNPLYIETFRALDANAVPMPFPEVFTALETKTVDGQENPSATILSSKFFEVQKHVVLSRHIYSVWVPLFSKKVWDTYSPAEQNILTEAAKEAQAFERKVIRAYDSKALDDLKARGMQITELPAAEVEKLRAKTLPVAAKFSNEFGSAAAQELNTELAKLRKK